MLAALALVSNAGADAGSNLGDDSSVKRFRVLDYVEMADPAMAAEKMLRDAADAGVDVDQVPRNRPMRGQVSLRSGELTPDPGDTSFVHEVNRHAMSWGGAPNPVCLVKLSRWPSIREQSKLLAEGMRIFKQVPYGTYVAQIPPSAIRHLLELPFVSWIGEYRPEYKLSDSVQRPDAPLLIVTLDGDMLEARRGLHNLGLEFRVIGHPDIGYTFVVEKGFAHANEIATLWWVYRIYQDPVGSTQSRSDKAGRFSSLAFAPDPMKVQDSRKLVSALYDSAAKGSIKIGMTDNGCDWNHPDLSPRVDAQSSDAAIDSLHGTHVAGIMIGKAAWNEEWKMRFCKEEWGSNEIP
jgi:hypothetical protein